MYTLESADLLIRELLDHAGEPVPPLPFAEGFLLGGMEMVSHQLTQQDFHYQLAAHLADTVLITRCEEATEVSGEEMIEKIGRERYGVAETYLHFLTLRAALGDSEVMVPYGQAMDTLWSLVTS